MHVVGLLEALKGMRQDSKVNVAHPVQGALGQVGNLCAMTNVIKCNVGGAQLQSFIEVDLGGAEPRRV